jgi:hypothetical protein
MLSSTVQKVISKKPDFPFMARHNILRMAILVTDDTGQGVVLHSSSPSYPIGDVYNSSVFSHKEDWIIFNKGESCTITQE